MDINYWDEDFDKEDIEDVNDLDELESMGNDLQNQIWDNLERSETLKENMKIVDERIKEIRK